MKIEFWWRQIFEILIIHKPSLWSRDVPQKNWTRSVQPFWRLLDTNKQTDKPNLYIDIQGKSKLKVDFKNILIQIKNKLPWNYAEQITNVRILQAQVNELKGCILEVAPINSTKILQNFIYYKSLFIQYIYALDQVRSSFRALLIWYRKDHFL